MKKIGLCLMLMSLGAITLAGCGAEAPKPTAPAGGAAAPAADTPTAPAVDAPAQPAAETPAADAPAPPAADEAPK